MLFVGFDAVNAAEAEGFDDVPEDSHRFQDAEHYDRAVCI